MAVNLNAMWTTRGEGRAAPPEEPAPPAKTASAVMSRATFNPALLNFATVAPALEVATQPSAPVDTSPALPASALRPALTLANANLLGRLGDIAAIRPELIRPELIRPFFPIQPVTKTATQLAQGAINLLNGASRETLTAAVSAIRNKSLTGEGLMNLLERRVRVGEALNELAKDWADETKQDFAREFSIEPNRLEVMDAIVSLAILNDRDLEEELRGENLIPPSQSDLLENRRVVFQWPPPGTPLEPPYLVLIAVENQNVAQAEDAVKKILGDLVAQQGFKMPQAAAQKLG